MILGLSKIYFFRLSDFRNFQDSTCLTFLLSKIWEKPIVLDPRKIQIYLTKIQYFFKHVFDLVGVAYVLKARDSQISS